MIFWLLGALAAAMIAERRGRQPALWLCYGLLIAPLAVIHSLLLSPNAAAVAIAQQKQGRRACPRCAEWVMKQAEVCHYCGEPLSPLHNSRPEAFTWIQKRTSDLFILLAIAAVILGIYAVYQTVKLP